MTYTHAFAAPTYTKAWAGPPRHGTLGTVHLIGDVQTYWETVYPTLSPNTVYDVAGIDTRDHMNVGAPDVTIQVGDCSDYEAPNLATLIQRYNLMRQWVDDYDLGLGNPVYYVMGNHDVVGVPGQTAMITAAQWAEQFGYAAPSYSIDLGEWRILVIGPTGTGAEMSPQAGSVPVRPMTAQDLAWLDGELNSDTRPTMIVNHAPVFGMATFGANQEDVFTDWRTGQSTVPGGARAPDLIDILDSYPHLFAWGNGHTHSNFSVAPNNLSLFNTGGRLISVVDASRIFQRPRYNDRSQVVSPWVSLLDDGKTIDVRWRDHDKMSWVPYDRVHLQWLSTAT